MRMRFALTVTSLFVAAASACGESAEEASEKRAATTTTTVFGFTVGDTSEPTTTVFGFTVGGTTVPTTTEVPPATAAALSSADAIAALRGPLAEGMNKSDLVPLADEACFQRAITALSGPDQLALSAVIEDPQAYHSIEEPARSGITKAYFKCVDENAMLTVFLLGIGIVEDGGCISDRWHGKLTAEVVASSIAYGRALDDLPPDLVAQLTADVMACWNDQQWWTEELALELTRHFGASEAQADCMSRAYVGTLGIEPFIARRVLTLSPFALPPEDLARANIASRCSVTLTAPPDLQVTRGSCITNWGSNDQTAAVADCAGRHNAEVISVHDLTASHSSWPGASTLQQESGELCAADAAALSGYEEYSTSWSTPSRETWEFGQRDLICTLAREDYATWEGQTLTS